MRVRILGSAAGGGLPQWNCACANCAAVRAGSPDVQARSQSSVAVSADGQNWFLLNVSPDVRQQILAFPELGPPAGVQRGSTIAGCMLTDAELDHTAGLLLLREGGIGRIFCTPLVRRWLNCWLPIEPVLAHFAKPSWNDLPLSSPVPLPLPDGSPSGLQVRAFEVDPHAPRFVAEETPETIGSVIGLRIDNVKTGSRLVYAPCVGSIAPALRAAAEDADCVLIDGTFWSDEEPILAGIGNRTACEMGHIPVSGPYGSLNFLAELKAHHHVYVHINNTNPMVNRSGPEYREVTEAGVRVGTDGDVFDL